MATYNGHQEDSSGNILLPISNSMAATIETGSTASQAYTKGSYFYFNNKLVKASTAISSGATLTIGSNIAYVNAADEMTAHLRANDTNKSEFYFDVKDGNYGFYPSASKVSSEFVPFGGSLSETTLWTNSSPTSSFSGQDITLSNSISNYTYLRAYYRYSTTTATERSTLMSVTDFKATINGSSGNVWWEIGTYGSGSNCYGRGSYYISDTKLHFNYAYQVGTNTGSANTNVIPTKICGVK